MTILVMYGQKMAMVVGNKHWNSKEKEARIKEVKEKGKKVSRGYVLQKLLKMTR